MSSHVYCLESKYLITTWCMQISVLPTFFKKLLHVIIQKHVKEDGIRYLGLGGTYNICMGYFWLLSVQGQSKVIRYIFDFFPIFNNLVSPKWLVVEQNGHKFGPRGYLLSLYGVPLAVKCSRLFWGHSVHFWYLRLPTTLYLKNGLEV